MRQRPDTVMLFAAGFGTRMGALTHDLPKPLIKVAGKALIDHALAQVRAADLDRIVVNAHYKADQIRAHVAESDILVSHESPDLLDTGGGLRAALPLTGPGPLFTMNTDAVWAGPNPLVALASKWDPDRMDALLLCVSPTRAIGHAGAGDFELDNQGRATRGPGLVYTGAQILKSDLLAHIPDDVFSLNLLWDRMIKAGRLYGLPYDGHWCDVGHPAGIALAEDMLRNADV
ncbi:nucleotidyltransferase family protein [Pseudohalocynthiibacter aestuariivivens]|uniref:Nucleotidyltransferase family protein n=1 Tax=Roseovarius pelagicus TaxID=2980108 RepID=A0ABY6D6Z6_9RHOB|nr:MULTISPECIES: nucleotidyltransferase family protein [Rhodobacterales]QIE46174.1 nucleotidyltransferase family protein [Pseudohalocynthiibacter aestuariivivens]UXX81863.1 nucleotidyltransferase family protein [Roseovarius pelagicus]